MKKYILPLLLIFIAASPAWSADTLINLPQEAPAYSYAPGMTIILPDGQRGVIEELLPNGDFRTSLGQIVSPQGVVISGPNEGESVVVKGSSPSVNIQVNPQENKSLIPDSSKQQPQAVETPVIKTPETPENKPEQKIQKAETPKTIEQPRQKKPEQSQTVKTPDQPQEQRLTIAQMLPSTAVPAEEPAKEKIKQPEKAKKPEPVKEKPKAHVKEKTEPKKQAQPQKPQKATAREKPKPGQALRIPPDAPAQGDLAFLEGCWQGTRPEYYSKRTIKECFCFGTNGSGKRRVIDPSGGRMCIGATRAHLSKDGVLSVTSSGAACTDGERWGSAEMVCRNSGPHTPCSWIFRDANNGRQAYAIPFVRVESCGR